jgi:hypothetical protein
MRAERPLCGAYRGPGFQSLDARLVGNPRCGLPGPGEGRDDELARPVTIRVAALFVLPDGPYAGRPDVDVWDEVRDARTYSGPHPVVAHPPCQRWGNLWWSAQNARGPSAPGLGEDGGCFESALAAVRRWGGVLEHPERSRAFEAFSLGQPRRGSGWQASLFGGWICVVDQGRYGHRARKRSWLYLNGTPAELDWSEASSTAWVCSGPGGATSAERAARSVELMGKRERKLTPPAFAEVLLSLARGARS